MFTLPTGSVPPQSAPSAPAPSPAAAERARRLAITADSTLEMLARVTDAARRLAETATPEVVARRLPPLVRTHAVLTRAIRCINAMEARQEEEATAARTVRAQAEQTRVRARKTLIRRVEDTIAERARPEARENLMREFYERLDDTDLAEDLALEPLQSVFAQTCSDLGLMNGPNHRFRRTPATLAALLARAQLHPRARPTATGRHRLRQRQVLRSGTAPDTGRIEAPTSLAPLRSRTGLDAAVRGRRMIARRGVDAGRGEGHANRSRRRGG